MKELDIMRKAASEASDYAAKARKTASVSGKGAFDIVTEADKEAERIIISIIQKEFPNDAIVAEETSPDESPAFSGHRCWTIDPIDGTWNYANGVQGYGAQIAFIDEGKVIASVIRIPDYGGVIEAYAQKGKGAYINEFRVVARPKENLLRTIVLFGCLPANETKVMGDELKMIGRIRQNVGMIRMLGASSLAMALVADGRVDAYVGFSQHLWDRAPGSLICSEAGCHVLSRKGTWSLADANIAVAVGTAMESVISSSWGEKRRLAVFRSKKD
jgi:myo-inositol-1(or 4)-monophosphatase